MHVYSLLPCVIKTHPLSLHPSQHVGSAHNYSSSSGAKAAIASLGREIQYGMLPESLGPLIFTFTGAGNVSQVILCVCSATS